MPSSRSVGGEAERRAAQYLETQGFKVIERNFTCRLGEIDLVCEEGATLVFVEVRSRKWSRYGHPEESISREKKRRIANTARLYLLERKLGERECRFDVVSILGSDPPIHQRDAFDDSFYKSG